jgi:hypothetical protein
MCRNKKGRDPELDVEELECKRTPEQSATKNLCFIQLSSNKASRTMCILVPLMCVHARAQLGHPHYEFVTWVKKVKSQKKKKKKKDRPF